jgi:hypothetical protein
MTPTLLLPSVIPGDATHVRRYTPDRRAYWACSVAGWAPCQGHVVAAPPPPERVRVLGPCVHGHPAERMRFRPDGTRRCLECGLRRYHAKRAA